MADRLVFQKVKQTFGDEGFDVALLIKRVAELVDILEVNFLSCRGFFRS